MIKGFFLRDKPFVDFKGTDVFMMNLLITLTMTDLVYLSKIGLEVFLRGLSQILRF